MAATFLLLALAIDAPHADNGKPQTTKPPQEATKRLNPEVKTPDEFSTAVVRVQLRSYIFTDEAKKIAVIEDGKAGTEIRRMMFEDVEDLMKLKGVRLAEKVLPVRMAIITASFPYQKQVEEFRRSLRLGTNWEAHRQVAFRGFHVQRRDVGRDGKAEEWNDRQHTIDIVATFKQILKLNGRRLEAEHPKLKLVTFPGLVMPRPMQFEPSYSLSPFEEDNPPPYPPPESKLKHVADTLKDLARRNQPFVPPGESKDSPVKQPKGWQPPEYCLLRFLDMTVQPGKSYEYRFQIRMANSNFKNAKEKEIVSAWVQLPDRVVVPPDFQFYAVDMTKIDKKFRGPPPGKNQVAVQLHRWLENLGAKSGLKYPVGDWIIAERVLSSRGEYIGGTHEADVPVWDVIDGRFSLARDPARRVKTRWDIPFTDDKERAPLLVNFEGGTVAYKRVKNTVPLELLVLSPEGKLLVRNSETDAKDAVWKARYADWKRRIDEIKKHEKQEKRDEAPSPFKD